MPFNSSGTFTRIHNWVQDAANGIFIEASRMDAEMNGFANGLTACIKKNGSSAMEATLDLGNHKIIRLTDPENPTDAANKKYVDDNFLTAGIGGIGEFGNDLALVVDFALPTASGFYRWSSASLNPPIGSGGGAIVLNRIGNDSDAAFAWLAFESAGSTGSNDVKLFAASTSGVADNDLGDWVEILHTGNSGLSLGETITGDHIFTGEITFEENVLFEKDLDLVGNMHAIDIDLQGEFATLRVETSYGSGTEFQIINDMLAGAEGVRFKMAGTAGGAGVVQFTSGNNQWLSIDARNREIKTDTMIMSSPKLVITEPGGSEFPHLAFGVSNTGWVAKNDGMEVYLSILGNYMAYFDENITVAANSKTVMTRDKGDYRYIQSDVGSVSETDVQHINGRINIKGNSGDNILRLYDELDNIRHTFAANGDYTCSGNITGNGNLIDSLNANNINNGTLNSNRLPTDSSARNWVREQMAKASAGDVGSYAFLSANGNAIGWGSTYAGSALKPAGIVQSGSAADAARNGGPSISGTWRAMGYAYAESDSATTFLRIV